MAVIKPIIWKKFELASLFTAYGLILLNIFVFKDSLIAAASAFFGITYTMLAGKGNPKCYLFGLAGSGLYCWLSLCNGLWGNLALYLLYYIPMQVLGFFKWNQNLKTDSHEIIKTKLNKNEAIKLGIITILSTMVLICILYLTHDRSPIMDGITTVFSITGMYLTVKRCFEQWIVWITVNGISALMWINILVNGEKVYSTVVMWLVYFILAIYFYKNWKREVV